MINGRAALLRIVTCVVGSGILLLLSLLFFPINWDSHGNVWVSGVHLSGSRPYGLSALEIIGIGALVGLLPGIAWAIDQKSARRRFLLWSILGAVVGFILMTATHRTIPMIVFPVAGVYVGNVSALNRLGVFGAKESDQPSEQRGR